jgi:hypothetical protein
MRYPKRRGETTRLPDGTVVYPDGRTEQGSTARKGTRQRDGSIIYPDGRVRLPDGRVKYPDGTVRFPNSRNKNVKRLPPGQAKKVYGGRATDYAPGQIKDKKNRHDDDDRRHRDHDDDDDDHGKGKKNKAHKGNKKGKK